MEPVGYMWLQAPAGTGPIHPLARRSYTSPRSARALGVGGQVEIFPQSYRPPDEPLEHVRFALRYEGVNLGLLRQAFRRLPTEEVDKYIGRHPNSVFSRQIGFLYEMLTGRILRAEVGGNYVDILDPERYVTAKARRVTRWHANDNLLGNAEYCPVVRRTDAVDRMLAVDWSQRIHQALGGVSAKLLARTLSYLYLKETKSSAAIEREEIGGDRQQRFVSALFRAGRGEAAAALDAPVLTELQNVIVEARFREKGFRTTQNFVGQTMPGGDELVHYVCPSPDRVESLMTGLAGAAGREMPPVVKAAIIPFGFVFIHPFEDGNGRIHRFLIHDTMVREGMIEKGVLLPLSSTILADIAAYDRTLEAFSQPVMNEARYELTEGDKMLVQHNADELDPLWRYPDLTDQVGYFGVVLDRCISEDLPKEIEYLRRWDNAREAIRSRIDLPDRKLDLLLTVLHQHAGRLSESKRKSHFLELSAQEIADAEDAYAGAHMAAASTEEADGPVVVRARRVEPDQSSRP